MARLTGYGQSARIEWDRPIEFYSARYGESIRDYMCRVLTSRGEIEITRRFLNRKTDKTFQIAPHTRYRSITTQQVQNYFARHVKEVFDINSIFNI